MICFLVISRDKRLYRMALRQFREMDSGIAFLFKSKWIVNIRRLIGSIIFKLFLVIISSLRIFSLHRKLPLRLMRNSIKDLKKITLLIVWLTMR